MRALIIDENIKEQAKQILEFARIHKFSMDDLLDISNKQEPPAGDRDGYWMEIPIGYRVVCAFEEQNMGLVKHVSVSVNSNVPGALPSIEAAAEILMLFEIDGPLTQHQVWIEANGPVSVLHVHALA